MDEADLLPMALLVNLFALYSNQEGVPLLWIQLVAFGMLTMLQGIAKIAELF